MGYDFFMKIISVLLCLLFVPVVSTFAGTAIQARVQSYSYQEAWADVDVSFDQNKMRLDFKGPWSHGSLIYDRETSWLILVDDLHKTTFTVTPRDQATLKLLGGLAIGIAESHADKENGDGKRTFETLRKNVRSFFNGDPRLEAKGVRTAGMVCDKYSTVLEGEKAREVWAARLETTAMNLEDYNTFRSFIHLALDLTSGELTQLGADPEDFQRLLSEPLVPVVSVLYAKGKPASRYEMQSLRPRSFSVGFFDPPARYQSVGLLDLLKPPSSSKP